ncbi:MAG TPA: c-type cytochrome [Gaiellaceae bacterium]|nr:c-type cytochrome [Gaiellaceae bacterium]
MRLGPTALSAAAALLLLGGCGSEAHVETAGNTTRGKELFTQKCGACHTLADAGARGTIGPNLDDAFHSVRVKQGFEESTIRDLVRGQIAYPTESPPAGGQGMPADIVTGDDADAVASYVASVAGLPVKQAAGGGGGAQGSTDGKTLFTTNCASCHTLAAAGTSGNVGPNLDQAKPPKALVVDRVTNGKGVMPSFKGQLTDAQIQAVAEYVSTSAGG